MTNISSITCFVINLDRDKHRWRKMQENWPAGIALSRYDAVDGRKLESMDGSAVRHTDRLSKPELACMLSHLGIWKKMLAEDISLAVVFEDDARVSADFTHKLNLFVARLPAHFDIAYLGYNADMHVHFEVADFGRVSAILDKEQYQVNSAEVGCFRLFRAWGTCGYVVSKAGAERLIDLIGNREYPERQNFTMPTGCGGLISYSYPCAAIDMRIMSIMHEIQAYVAFPALCKADTELPSTIQDQV